jgi:hypothetical protein
MPSIGASALLAVTVAALWLSFHRHFLWVVHRAVGVLAAVRLGSPELGYQAANLQYVAGARAENGLSMPDL